MLNKEYCKKCTTYECDLLLKFLKRYNDIYIKEYNLIECPDKKEEKQLGKKPDILIEDRKNKEMVVLEHKKVFHSYGRGKGSNKKIAKENIRNILYSYISAILSSFIEEYGIKKKFLVEIAVFKNTKEKYVEEEFIPKVYDDLKEKIINNQYYLFEDDILKIEIKENYTQFLKQQILFSFPTNTNKGQTDKGISFDELFQRSLDYDELLRIINLAILDKCKGKFEKYNNYKKIILLELIFSYGDDIMVDINKLDCKKGFKFEYLKQLFINQYNPDKYNFVDEIILYFENDSIQKILKLK